MKNTLKIIVLAMFAKDKKLCSVFFFFYVVVSSAISHRL